MTTSPTKPNASEPLSATKQALLALRDMQSQLAASEYAKHEPIAIVGLGCRFPGGADTPDAFWELLNNGVDAIETVPAERWNIEDYYDPNPDAPGKMYSRYGSFVKGIDGFDPGFFGISPREAVSMDPQQRMLLEVCWETLESANQNPEDLFNSPTGVFVGICTSDYAKVVFSSEDDSNIDAYFATGNTHSVAAGRLSYALGFTGPSIAVDTACSSSLVAVHLAVQSLRNKECDMALAGGVNLLLSPQTSITFSKARMMSPDGRCKTFDAAADGYVRGEGCGAIALKRLSDATAAGDNILAVIKGSAINQDGPSGGLTVPNGPAQERVLKQALASSQLKPSDVDYIEAHGTGTALGDPIEVEALGSVFGKDRTKQTPLLLGSVKTNIGHLEGAAGIAGIIKVVLSMQHNTIPEHLHFSEPSPHINWDAMPVQVAAQKTSWERNGHPRAAGVSSFGFSGTNAHIVIGEAPTAEVPEPNMDRPLHLLTLSAKSPAALQTLGSRYQAYLAEQADDSAKVFSSVCLAANVGRAHFKHRLSVVASSTAEATRRLTAYFAGEEPVGVVNGAATSRLPGVAFLFTGQGSQYWGMGRELYESQPVFREWIDRCDQLLQSELETSLRDLLFSDSDTTTTLNQTANTQPALFAVEYALAKLWMSWGVQPAAVMGHSVGEYVAACVAEVFSLADGLRLIAARGRLMQALPTGGGMVSVLATEEKVREVIAPFSDLSIAAVNGPQSIVISGPQTSLDKVVASLQTEDIKTKALAVSHAFHSAQMDAMLADFRKVAETVEYFPPEITMVSNLTGGVVEEEIATADYWCDHVRKPVLFYQGMQAIAQLQPDAYLEVGPKPILLGMGRQCIAEADTTTSWLPSLRSGQGNWQSLFDSLGQLYVQGAAIDWKAVDGDYAQQKAVLPGYPFQKQRYWVDAVASGSVAGLSSAVAIAQTQSQHPLLGSRLALAGSGRDVRYSTQLSITRQPYLNDHRIYQQVIVPAAAYVEMALAAGQKVLKQPTLQLQSVSFQQPLMLSGTAAQTVQVVLTPPDKQSKSTYQFEIFSLSETNEEETVWISHATGIVASADGLLDAETVDISKLKQSYSNTVVVDDFYQQLASQEMAYGPAFQGIQQIISSETGALGEVQLPTGVAAAGYGLHPALLDACFQVLGTLMPADSEAAYLPVAIEQMIVTGSISGPLWSKAEVQASEGKAQTETAADITLFDASGEPVAQLKGLKLKRVPKKLLQMMLQQDVEEWLYRLDWEPVSSTAGPVEKGDRWLVFADENDAVLQQLQASDVQCTLVSVGDRFQKISETAFQLNPAHPEQYAQLLTSLPPLQGIVHSWGSQSVDIDSLSFNTLRQSQQQGCGSILHLVQALTSQRISLQRGLWLTTREAHTQQPQQASIWGLGRVAILEHPELNCRCLDFDLTGNPPILDILYSTEKDTQIAYRDGQRYAARLLRYQDTLSSSRSSALPAEPFQARISDYGILENLQLVPLARQAPQTGEVEIEVRSVGLNFRDVLNALGMLKDFTEQMGITDAKDLPFGGECAGIVAAAGEGVTALKVGDPVIATQTIGSLGSFVTVSADFVVSKPQSLSFDEAATIPTAFLTAYYALHEKAKVKKGDRVLIHSAAGGVGQAAVQIAHWLGATVWGTASESKWGALKEMGVAHTLNSRTLDFSQQVLDTTDGKGVDVVLNSLNGEFIPRSLEAIAKQGRFVEIGKLGIWSKEQVAEKRVDVDYMPFDLLNISLERPGEIRALLETLMPLFEGGQAGKKRSLEPLNLVSFPIEDRVEAFRYMAQAKHIGKVVISIPELAESEEKTAFPESSDAFEISSEGTYLITGGLGALGLEVAQWLTDGGAKQIALMGRSQPSEKASEAIEQLEKAGATVQVLKADVSDKVSLSQALQKNSVPLKGIFHVAGLLDDAMLSGQSWQSFEKVMKPKVEGTLLLHQLTADQDLDCFVCFSSVAALMGSPGQANYAAANALMDAFAQYRRDRSLNATSINWGPWASSGMAAAQHSRNQARWAASGVKLIEPDQGLSLMSQVLKDDKYAQAAVLPVDWSTYLSQLPSSTDLSLLKLFQSAQAKSSGPPTLLIELQQAPAHKRRTLLSKQLQALIAKVLGLEAHQVEVEQGFADLGMDSLMAVEMRNRIQTGLGCDIPTTLAFDYPTIQALTGYLVEELALEEPTGETPKEKLEQPESEAESAALDEISDDDLADLLAQELNAIQEEKVS